MAAHWARVAAAWGARLSSPTAGDYHISMAQAKASAAQEAASSPSA